MNYSSGTQQRSAAIERLAPGDRCELLILSLTPSKYYAPLYQELGKRPELGLTVYFYKEFGR